MYEKRPDAAKQPPKTATPSWAGGAAASRQEIRDKGDWLAVGALILRVADPGAAALRPEAPRMETRTGPAALREGFALGVREGRLRGGRDARHLNPTWLSHRLMEKKTMVYLADDHHRLGRRHNPWHRNSDMSMNRHASDELAELVSVRDPAVGAAISRLRAHAQGSSSARAVYEEAYRLGIRTGHRAAWLEATARAVLDAAIAQKALVDERVTPASLNAARATSLAAAVAHALPPARALPHRAVPWHRTNSDAAHTGSDPTPAIDTQPRSQPAPRPRQVRQPPRPRTHRVRSVPALRLPAVCGRRRFDAYLFGRLHPV
ncbi:hypothetical protein GCM10023205_48660 [Yinghuangia aomiensis]|uniref:Uncharacterized protein n=1 Tax=Yinghuangia aomiensis TaxID=676205 RepID=A0ABP9HQW2_9ACTN